MMVPLPPFAVLLVVVRTLIPLAATENFGEEAATGVTGKAADLVMLTAVAETLALSDAAILFWTFVAAASMTLLAASVETGRAFRALTFCEVVVM